MTYCQRFESCRVWWRYHSNSLTQKTLDWLLQLGQMLRTGQHAQSTPWNETTYREGRQIRTVFQIMQDLNSVQFINTVFGKFSTISWRVVLFCLVHSIVHASEQSTVILQVLWPVTLFETDSGPERGSFLKLSTLSWNRLNYLHAILLFQCLPDHKFLLWLILLSNLFPNNMKSHAA